MIDIDPESGFEQFVVRKGKRRIKLKPEINESVIDSIILSPQDKKLGEKEGGHIVFKQTKTGIRLEGLVVFPSLQFGRKPFFIKQRELMKFAMEYISIIFYVCKELDIWMNPELIELFERHRKGQAVSFDNLLKVIS